MTAPLSSLALREIRGHLTTPAVLAVQAGVALVLGLSGPFDTFSEMRPGPRMAYWAIVVFFTYGAGYTLSELAAALMRPHGFPLGLLVLLSAIAAGLGAGTALAAINALALDNPLFPSGWLQNTALATPIALVVVTLQEIMTSSNPDARKAVDLPSLLERISLEKRGPLVSLSVSDHYVEVVTTRGREMILMRLSDAIRETAPTRGMQVHRSHWVALDQVTSLRKTGETAVLRTSAGGDIPVSRTYMSAVRDSGLTPFRSTAGNSNG